MCGARGAVHAWITVDVNADDSAQQSRVQSMDMVACTHDERSCVVVCNALNAVPLSVLESVLGASSERS